MSSIILSVAVRLLAALLILFSLYMLLRGHNEPGGGFIGGLVAVALIAGMAALFAGEAPFAGLWLFLGAEGEDKGLPLSTVLLFDIGVYLVVVGGVSAIVLALEEEC